MKISMFSRFSNAIAERGAKGAVEYAASLGFDAVEPFHINNIDNISLLSEVKKELDDHGMCAACYSASVNLAAENADAELDKLKHCIELAHAIGSPFIHHTLVPRLEPLGKNDPSFEEILEGVVKRAGAAADYAAQFGMGCLFEDQGLYFNGCENFGKFFSALDRKNTGVCADLGNVLFVDGDPLEFVKRFAPYVKHVHIKDYLTKPSSSVDPGRGWYKTAALNYIRDTIPGHGSIDFIGCFSELKKAGYNGFFSSEFFGPEPFEDGTAKALENIKRFYEMA